MNLKQLTDDLNEIKDKIADDPEWAEDALDNVIREIHMAKPENTALQSAAASLALRLEELIANLPAGEIDLAREVWGNTNANIVEAKITNAKISLAAYRQIAGVAQNEKA